MKKVYIPTMDELYSLQEFGCNIYYYLLTKTIESLIMADVIYDEEDMFDVIYKEFDCSEILLLKIAAIYPERIAYSKRASSDLNLCTRFISTTVKQDSSIYGLDYMTAFSDDVLKSEDVLHAVIDTLAQKIKAYPRYRFEYKEPNPILDNIFACEISKYMITDNVFDEILSIDPIWLVKLKDVSFIENYELEARKAINNYACTYGFPAYSLGREKVDILTNPTEQVKKLIRCLDRHKQYYQY